MLVVYGGGVAGPAADAVALRLIYELGLAGFLAQMLPALWLLGRLAAAAFRSSSLRAVKLELWGKASLGLWRKSTTAVGGGDAGFLSRPELAGLTTAVVAAVLLLFSKVTWVSTLLGGGGGGNPTTCPRDIEAGSVAALV